jgi:segregation and condensation protein B
MVDEDLKNKIEALLFSSGKKVGQMFLAGLTGSSEQEIIDALNDLAKDYEQKNGALMIFQEGSEWKISVKEKYVSLVRKIVADTELSKSVLETLAVTAWKTPVLQSEVIKIRSNKAYDHISELVELSFITKEKKGRSFLLKTTDKFYQYFDVPDKKRFKEILKQKEAGQKKLDDVKEPEPEIKEEEKHDLEIVNIPEQKESEELEQPAESEDAEIDEEE